MDSWAEAGYAASWTIVGTSGETTVTEAKWLESTNPVGLLKHLWQARSYSVTARKMRLVACACLRRIWPRLSDKCRHAVEVAELHADGIASYAELQASHLRYAECSDDWFLAVYYAIGPNRSLRGLMESVFAYSTWAVRGRFAGIAGGDTLLGTAACEESVTQSGLVREVFPNPFRPSPPPPPAVLTWNNSLVVRLAQAAYDERHLPEGTLDNGRLAILADALEEAGCTDADILGHLRGSGLHVRGCWPVDLVLGKS